MLLETLYNYNYHNIVINQLMIVALLAGHTRDNK